MQAASSNVPVVAPGAEIDGNGASHAEDREPVVQPASPEPAQPSLREVLEASWTRNEAGYRYLAR